MSIPGCPHGPVEITGGPDSCPDCLKEQDAAREKLEEARRKIERLEHTEHVQRRVADGWYAVHTCQECKREFNQPGQSEQTAPTGCGHQQVMRHDYHTETWWQCEDCEQKFTPVPSPKGSSRASE